MLSKSVTLLLNAHRIDNNFGAAAFVFSIVSKKNKSDRFTPSSKSVAFIMPIMIGQIKVGILPLLILSIARIQYDTKWHNLEEGI